MLSGESPPWGLVPGRPSRRSAALLLWPPPPELDDATLWRICEILAATEGGLINSELDRLLAQARVADPTPRTAGPGTVVMVTKRERLHRLASLRRSERPSGGARAQDDRRRRAPNSRRSRGVPAASERTSLRAVRVYGRRSKRADSQPMSSPSEPSAGLPLSPQTRSPVCSAICPTPCPAGSSPPRRPASDDGLLAASGDRRGGLAARPGSVHDRQPPPGLDECLPAPRCSAPAAKPSSAASPTRS